MQLPVCNSNWHHIKQWFNSPYYSILYHYRDQKEANQILDTIEKLIPVSINHTIIDAGCGYGRLAITAALRGYKVIAIDVAEKTISRAQHLAYKYKVQNRIKFIVHDFRQPLPGINAHLLINMFSSFGYWTDQTEDQCTLQSFCSMLNYGGWLIIDYINPEWVHTNLKPFQISRHANLTFTISRWICKKAVLKRIHIHPLKLTFTEYLRLIYPSEWINMLHKAGFKIYRIVGDYKGEPLSQSSQRLIIIAQKVKP